MCLGEAYEQEVFRCNWIASESGGVLPPASVAGEGTEAQAGE